MSFAICRIQKISAPKDIAGIDIHNQRKRERSNTNPDIDHARTNENISFAAPDGSYNDTVDAIIKKFYKGKRAVRKDAVRMCEVLFTSDKSFFDKSEDGGKAYLTACYEWACNRFGENNVVAATIHMDEETPHMHFDFVPMTEDGRLSAKAVMGDRVDLQRLQDDFYEQVGKRFGLERGDRANIENGEKGRVHYDTPVYKEKTSHEKIQKAVCNIDTCLSECTPLETIEAKGKNLFHDASPKKVVLLYDDYVNIRKVLKASKKQIEVLTDMALEKEVEKVPNKSKYFARNQHADKVKQRIKEYDKDHSHTPKAKNKSHDNDLS